MLTANRNAEREQSRFSMTHAQWLLPLCLIWSLLPGICPATSLEQKNTDQLIAGSELIIEARVQAVQVRPVGPRALPCTYATLEIIDIIKGDFAKPTIELGFLGGTLSGQTLVITDMHPPRIGERGIYFVESLSRQQVHALSGWDQGHYLVRATDPDGVYRIYTRALQPVTGMKSTGFKTPGLSEGYAADLSVRPKTGGAVALPLETFKSRLRQKAGELQ